MKRCPECTSGFPDAFEFCERDGATLVPDYWDNAKASEAAAERDKSPQPADEPNVNAPATSYVDPPAVVGTIAYPVSVATRLRQNLIMLALMIIAGVAIALVVFVYQPFTREVPSTNANELIANGALTQQPMPALPSRPSPSPSESPSPEASPSPSAMPSPAAQLESLPVGLSSGMVTTGGDDKTGHGTITIRLTNGMKIEADDVWQTDDGIWYRRRGVATLTGAQGRESDRETQRENSSPPVSPTPSPASSRNATP